MTPTQACTAVANYWLAQWVDGASPRTPTQIDGDAGTEPALLAGDDPWARLSFRHIASRQDTLGATSGRRFRRDAIATVSVFTIANDGTGEALDLAYLARAVFEGVRFDADIDVYDCPIREVGTDGRWFQINLDVAFTYYEEK